MKNTHYNTKVTYPDRRIVGGVVVVVLSVVSLVGWIVVGRMLSGPNGLQTVSALQPDTWSHFVCMVLSAFALLFGVGLLWREAFPKSYYVSLSLCLLAASLFSTYTYFRTAAELTSTQETYASQMQQLSKEYLENAGIPPTVRTGEARQVLIPVKWEKQADAKHRRILVPLVADYALAITILATVGVSRQRKLR